MPLIVLAEPGGWKMLPIPPFSGTRNNHWQNVRFRVGTLRSPTTLDPPLQSPPPVPALWPNHECYDSRLTNSRWRSVAQKKQLKIGHLFWVTGGQTTCTSGINKLLWKKCDGNGLKLQCSCSTSACLKIDYYMMWVIFSAWSCLAYVLETHIWFQAILKYQRFLENKWKFGWLGLTCHVKLSWHDFY